MSPKTRRRIMAQGLWLGLSELYSENSSGESLAAAEAVVFSELREIINDKTLYALCAISLIEDTQTSD